MIPKNISEVTPLWLGECVGTSVSAFTPTQIGQGIGIMGDIFRVELQHDDAMAPKSVVVKFPSSFEENRSQGVALGMFEAEVRFYNTLAKQANVGIPAVFRADIESGTADFVIVMEDLTDLTMVDQFEGMNFAQAKAAVSVLAQIHAVWWNDVQKESLEWIPSMIGERIAFVDQMLGTLYEPFAAIFTEHLPEGGIEVFEKFSSSYLAINQVMAARSPWTLVHQDFRVENILFDGTDRVVVIDWQGIGRGPGAYDLAYILGGSMPSELRRQHEQELVRTYHDQLINRGIEGYSYEALWEDYGLAHFQGGLATSMFVGAGLDLNNDRGMQLGVTMARRHAAAALDHGGVARIEQTIGG